MKWFYQKLGRHIHVRVFIDRCYCGKLVFTKSEFESLKAVSNNTIIEFIDDNN